MATYNQNGRDALSDENRASWRPHDQPSSQGRYQGSDDDRDLRSFRDRSQDQGYRDPRRWEGSRGSELGYHDSRDSFGRSTEYYGQGQSGYSAGRHGDDRAQRWQNRNEMSPSPGRFEDRNQGFGIDDRFTGRGGRAGYWEDQRGYDPERFGAPGGYGGGRGFEADRGGWRGYDERMGYQGGYGPGGYGQSMGYQDSYHPGYGQNIGYQGSYAPGGYGRPSFGQSTGSQGSYGPGGYGPGQRGWGQNMGYQGDYGGPGNYAGREDTGMRGESQFYRESHRHGGNGPHRGKGPVGYQRSDERLREMISESLEDDDQIDASQIEVTVKNGEVTLTGTVEDRHSKRDAEECVYSVSGVREVQNLLRVKDDRRDERQAGKAGTSSQSGQSGYVSGKTEAETFSQDKKPRA